LNRWIDDAIGLEGGPVLRLDGKLIKQIKIGLRVDIWVLGDLASVLDS
jgi:hypothetical protein